MRSGIIAGFRRSRSARHPAFVHQTARGHARSAEGLLKKVFACKTITPSAEVLCGSILRDLEDLNRLLSTMKDTP